MILCSGLIVFNKKMGFACCGLAASMVFQCIAYGLYLEFAFICRAISVIGGLLMLYADTNLKQDKNSNLVFADFSNLSHSYKTKLFLFFGRILLVGLFFILIFTGEKTLFRYFIAGLAVVGCIMVIVGFKAQHTAVIFLVILSIFNLMLNNWWNLHYENPQRFFLKLNFRDVKKYDFFQIMSVCGGFLLLINNGSGQLSVDHKRKT